MGADDLLPTRRLARASGRIRCVSWQNVHFASTMALPAPSGRRGAAPAAAASASSPRHGPAPRPRPGRGKSRPARATVSERSTGRGTLPAAYLDGGSTERFAALRRSPARTYLPAGSLLLVYLPSSWVMTMKFEAALGVLHLHETRLPPAAPDASFDERPVKRGRPRFVANPRPATREQTQQMPMQ